MCIYRVVHIYSHASEDCSGPPFEASFVRLRLSMIKYNRKQKKNRVECFSSMVPKPTNHALMLSLLPLTAMPMEVDFLIFFVCAVAFKTKKRKTERIKM